ncbi:DUF3307 domain-containing protein [Rhizobium leguminosarum]|uniref:DUF3307 domain-containing protein n=1 Tax=Rhizobium leguminosarum TaxID=384 RepID=UPI002E1434D2|nr:DUF3307 domain-containing protein [Rhizobium leguminosarum]
MTAFELYALMVFGHYLGDFALQSKFIADGKNCKEPIPGVPWKQVLMAHAGIHGGLVGAAVAIAGLSHPELLHWAIVFGVAETAIHYRIDEGKCRKAFGWNVDQALHFLCKLAWTAGACVSAGMPILFSA